ncbi:phage antirepressor YoqD-like protein [Rhodanobacter sp. ANJX3]|uniref:phage antirepressor KilAC domain-containing protein n=1 Tax=Rhodanobacter sp. ANJX3 TaxID=2723083 RepID=UPI0016161BDB|nr:phage antirepressor KilAC domain-containing protein [Rhodanobacter sp. ANJX3]MBB5357506.1 phage antirepressor YoqD-like protein [Rhodanobacter sp. ANJX3]
MSIVLGNTTVRMDSVGRFNLNDIHLAAGGAHHHKPAYWLRNKQVKEIIADRLKAQISDLAPVVATRGRYGGTYVIKGLVYSYSMWVSAPFHNQVVDAYDAMAQVAEPGHVLPSNLSKIYRELADLHDENAALKKNLEGADEALRFHSKVGDLKGTYSITEAAHLLEMSGQALGLWMDSKGLLYKMGGPWLAKQAMLNEGYLVTRIVERNNGLRQQVRVTAKGLLYLHRRLKRATA